MEKKLKVELHECPDGDYVSISNDKVFVNIELDNGKGTVGTKTLLGLSDIEQEIEKARGEVVREIYNFVESESGKSGRKEILEFISKLTTK